MDWLKNQSRDYKNLRKNAVSSAGEESGGMTGGDWAGIGLQILGAVNAQKAAEEEQRKLEEQQKKAEILNKQRYGDQQEQQAQDNVFQSQDRRMRGLSFLDGQVDSNRAMSRKRTFRDAMYDSMRA